MHCLTNNDTVSKPDTPRKLQCRGPNAEGSPHLAATPRSADHVLRELLRAPHLAAHEGRETAADDRAHRDEGGATLHEPRKLRN